ncbi:hypothetical protein GOODEAATRI_007093, partial [Goodea atripinnis]
STHALPKRAVYKSINRFSAGLKLRPCLRHYRPLTLRCTESESCWEMNNLPCFDHVLPALPFSSNGIGTTLFPLRTFSEQMKCVYG